MSKQGRTADSVMLIVGLVISIGMAFTLGVYALVLRRKLWLRRKRLWMPASTPNSSRSHNNRRGWESHDHEDDDDVEKEEESSITAWNRHRQEQRRKAGRWSSRFRSGNSSWRSPKHETGSQNSILTDSAAAKAIQETFDQKGAVEDYDNDHRRYHRHHEDDDESHHSAASSKS